MKSRTCPIVAALILFLLIPSEVFGQARTIPPDIQAIRAKAQAGQELTEQEEARLEQWMDSVANGPAGLGRAGQGQTSAAKPGLAVAGQSQGGSSLPCPAKAPAQVAMAAPTISEYTALLQSLIKIHGARLGPGRAQLDAVLKTYAARRAWDDLGMQFMLRNMAGAAVYTNAVLALGRPKDALIANNLGAALNSIPDYRAAAIVLLYAAKLEPRLPNAAVNLGWVYFDSGNSSASKQWFARAAALDPASPDPEAADGYIAACRGDDAGAVKLLTASLRKRYSGVAARVLSELRAKEPVLPGAKKAKPEPPPPDTPKDPTPPSTDELVPELPVSEQPEETEAARPEMEQLAQELRDRISATAERIRGLSAEVKRLNRHATEDSGSISLPVVYDKSIFQYGQLALAVLPAGIAPYAESLATSGKNLSKRADAAAPGYLADMERSNKLLLELQEAIRMDDKERIVRIQSESEALAYKMCMQARRDTGYVYTQHFMAWQAGQKALRSSAPDFYAFTQPVLDHTYQPLIHDLLEAQREYALLVQYQQLTRYGISLASLDKSIQSMKCVPPKPPGPPKKAKKPVSKKDDPPPCPFEKGKLAIKLVVVTMELDCESVKFEGGEGVIFSYEKNFNTKEVKLGVMVGVKSEAGLGEGEDGFKLEAKAEAGIELTVQGDHVTDIAFKTKVGMTGSVGAQFGGELEARVGLNTGPSVKGEAAGSLPWGKSEGGLKQETAP